MWKAKQKRVCNNQFLVEDNINGPMTVTTLLQHYMMYLATNLFSRNYSAKFRKMDFRAKFSIIDTSPFSALFFLNFCRKKFTSLNIYKQGPKWHLIWSYVSYHSYSTYQTKMAHTWHTHQQNYGICNFIEWSLACTFEWCKWFNITNDANLPK